MGCSVRKRRPVSVTGRLAFAWVRPESLRAAPAFAALALLHGDGGDGAVVGGLLGRVLGVGGNLVDDGLGDAGVADGEDLGAGGLAETAADAILGNSCLHVHSSH